MKRNLILYAVCAFLASCSSDDGLPLLDTSSYADLESVTLTAKPIIIDDGDETRTSFLPSFDTDGNLSNLTFNWANGDTIGLFPISPIGGCQVYQALDNMTEGGALSATFDGGAWKLKTDNTYAAYYPFQPDMRVGDSYDVIPINMLGQKQVGKNSIAHLGDYDYMISPSSKVNEDTKNVNFNFDHIVSFAWLKLTMPVIATWKKLVIEAQEPVFITSAKLNLMDGSLKNKVYSKTIELDLENVTTSKDEVVMFYLAVLPTSTDDLVLTAITDKDAEYTAELKGRNFTGGVCMRWAKTLTATTDEYDDLPYVDLGTGTLWARNNVKLGEVENFTTNSNKDEYYEWYGLEVKKDYSWTTYYGYDQANDKCTYCNPDDEQYYLDPINDDVAYLSVAPYTAWRIPTPAEMQSLIDNCDWTWTQVNGVNGYKVRHKTIPARWIFLPALGSVSGTSITESGSVGYYWTSELDTESDGWKKAKCLKFTDGTKTIASYFRYIGMSIRPVYIGE